MLGKFSGLWQIYWCLFCSMLTLVVTVIKCHWTFSIDSWKGRMSLRSEKRSQLKNSLRRTSQLCMEALETRSLPSFDSTIGIDSWLYHFTHFCESGASTVLVTYKMKAQERPIMLNQM